MDYFIIGRSDLPGPILGIRREEKALGYATQTINEQQVNEALSNNFINAHSGKVAGLNLVSPGS